MGASIISFCILLLFLESRCKGDLSWITLMSFHSVSTEILPFPIMLTKGSIDAKIIKYVTRG